jgi:regulator of protease activity HflC (stomatin/prohibitin superfamily)
MKKLVNISVLALALLFLGCTRVGPGYVGIVVNQWGSNRGVDDFPLRTGRVVYNPFTCDVYEFPTFVQSVVWCKAPTEDSPADDSITFNSVEGAVINADLALAYAFAAEKIPQIFVEFRQEPSVITHGFMKNEINNSFNRFASTMKATDIFGEKKQELLDKVKKDLTEKLAPKGFRFELISFHGGLRVDATVQNSINAVLSAAQRSIEAQNKVAQSRAEAEQSIAKASGDAMAIYTNAVLQAKANRELAASLTPELLQYKLLEKWGGVPPQVIGSGVMPFINLDNNKK